MENNALVNVESAAIRAVKLEAIEARIRQNVHGAAVCLIEIGRALNDAKDGDLVAHGAWEGWVEEHAHISVRQAQRWMRLAREVGPDSQMMRLEASKIEEVLKLPEEEREAVARAAADESKSLRELREQVAQLLGEREKLTGENERTKKLKLEAEQHLRTVWAERNKMETDMRNAVRDSRMNHEAALRLQDELTEAREDNAEMRLKLQEALAAPPVVLPGISEEAQRIIDSLRADLEASEDREASAKKQLQQLQREQRAAEMEGARGAMDGGRAGSIDSIIGAVQAFIGAAGVLPQMGRQMAVARKSDREAVTACVETVARWVEDSRRALGTVEGSGCVW